MSCDRTRQFILPGIQDLNKDQDAALALPTEGQHLIVGGPGTGKSVVTLLRARRLAKSERTYRTLVYNRLLDNSNRHLFGEDEEFKAKTWQSWFMDLYEHFFENVPKHPPKKGEKIASIDWEAAERQVQSLENIKIHSDKFLVIDEGQDMPPAFYRILIRFGIENFYVAADQNQQIEPEKCSSRQHIEDILDIERDETLEMKVNYRNTRPIALLARHFYPDNPASPKPDIPNQSFSTSVPELQTYGRANSSTFAEIVNDILRLSDRNPSKLIGIITPNNKVREKFNNALVDANPKLDNCKPPIQTYFSGKQEPLRFDQGGLMIINVQSCKGLEFDIAILADIDRHQPKFDSHALKQRFYVMVARAREQLILLRTGEICPIVDALLPTDPRILVRK